MSKYPYLQAAIIALLFSEQGADINGGICGMDNRDKFLVF